MAEDGNGESTKVRKQVIAAVGQALAMLERPEVESQWDEASALDGMTVGALAAHLVRAAGATLAYLDRTDPTIESDDDLLTPVSYFHAAVDSPIHDQIKKVSAREAEAGHADVVADCRRVLDGMSSRLPIEPSDRLVGALGGRLLTLDDFCRTRLIEVLIHLDDLAVSVGVDSPEADPESSGQVIDILIGIARQRHGDRAVIHALARAERLDGTIFPIM